jgi:hypothetical protein
MFEILKRFKRNAIIGLIVFIAAMILLMYGISNLVAHGQSTEGLATTVAGGVIVLVIFILIVRFMT